MSDEKSFQYAKAMFLLFRAIVKFCSTNRLLTDNISEDISGYVLFDCGILSKLFELLCCPVCGTQNLKLVEVEEKRKGFPVSFCLICQGCAWEKDFASSNSVNIPTYDMI